jgi:hypothetical protein
MSGYANDRSWSDRYIPLVASLVAPKLLIPAPFERDTKEATDLIVLTARDLKIAVRLRRQSQFKPEYGNQITFRARRSNGVATELEKIIGGFGDWFFYGWAFAEDPPEIVRWFLVDLNAWRIQYSRALRRKVAGTKPKLQWGEQSNSDGETSFCWFDLATFDADPKVQIAGSELLQDAKVIELPSRRTPAESASL